MEIVLKKEQEIDLCYKECPNCNEPFNATNKKRTSHHALPKFMNPKTEITINLCLECHNKLNSFYKTYEIMYLKDKKTSNNFESFYKNYEELREKFHEKKINRGQFGEGLWSNLVSYLEAIK